MTIKILLYIFVCGLIDHKFKNGVCVRCKAVFTFYPMRIKDK